MTESVNVNGSINGISPGPFRYEYIYSVPQYRVHPPYQFTVNPQFYRYPVADKQEELVWFIPTMSKNSDCKNPENVLKQCYADHIYIYPPESHPVDDGKNHSEYQMTLRFIDQMTL